MKKLVVASVILALGVVAEALQLPTLSRENVPRVVPPRHDEFKLNLEKVIDLMLQRYQNTDWTEVETWVREHPLDEGNPNIMAIPLSLSNAYINRYEAKGNPADLELALEQVRYVVESYPMWRERWLTPFVAGYLDLTLKHLEASSQTRLLEAGEVTRLEYNFWAAAAFPNEPVDSSETGDTFADDYSWLAEMFGWGANRLPNDPNSPLWEAKGRQRAYDTYCRASDLPDFMGVKVTTVTEDGRVNNHNLFPDPVYPAGTLSLLAGYALAYRSHCRAVPEEAFHNVGLVYRAYLENVNPDFTWNVKSDPPGDATLFPLPNVGDPAFEYAVVAAKAKQGTLWWNGTPVDSVHVGDSLWEAVLDSKVVMMYMKSYMWHFPSEPCKQ